MELKNVPPEANKKFEYFLCEKRDNQLWFINGYHDIFSAEKDSKEIKNKIIVRNRKKVLTFINPYDIIQEKGIDNNG